MIYNGPSDVSDGWSENDMVQPAIGTRLLRIGGYYLNKVNIVTYKGWFDKPGYHKCRMINMDGYRISHTPQPRHLFTLDGIDIHTGKKPTSDMLCYCVIMNFIKNEVNSERGSSEQQR